jgi:predicted RNA-binding Zn-ribbon protein involved in translation (DUF1610 family)
VAKALKLGDPCPICGGELSERDAPNEHGGRVLQCVACGYVAEVKHGEPIDVRKE